MIRLWNYHRQYLKSQNYIFFTLPHFSQEKDSSHIPRFDITQVKCTSHLIIFCVLYCRYRGQSDYPCSKETLFEYVDPLPPPAPRLRWDSGIKNVEVIRHISKVWQVLFFFQMEFQKMISENSIYRQIWTNSICVL